MSKKYKKDLIKYNSYISAAEVRVIDSEDNALGIMSTKEAIKLARGKNMDLVEVASSANPPVCKIIEVGRYKYLQKKNKSETQKKNKKTAILKDIKARINIDKHDLETKIKAIIKFLGEGDKVRVTITYRPRDVANNANNHISLCDSIIAAIDEKTYHVIAPPKIHFRKVEFILQGIKEKAAKVKRPERGNQSAKQDQANTSGTSD